MLSLLEHMYHELNIVKEFNINPITLKRWLVGPCCLVIVCLSVSSSMYVCWAETDRVLVLCAVRRAAVRTGELSQQPVPQLPSLFLRHSDDVWLRASLFSVEQTVTWRHRHPTDGLRVSWPRSPRIQQRVCTVYIRGVSTIQNALMAINPLTPTAVIWVQL